MACERFLWAEGTPSASGSSPFEAEQGLLCCTPVLRECIARPPVSRVLCPMPWVAPGIGWRPSIWDDGYPPPRATYPETARDEPLPPYLVLLRAGFAQPAGHPTAGALLPHHLTLTAAAAEAETGRRCVSVRFPSARAAWELPSALSRGARTFLDLRTSRRPRPPGGLARFTLARPGGISGRAPRWPSRRLAG